MQLKRLLTDEDAVSPALGVALLIAITVILVAVVGAVVLGIGPNAGEAPNAQLEFEQGSGDVTAVHKGGDKLVASEMAVKVNGSGSPGSISSDMTSGDSTVVATSMSTGDTVRVVWQSPSSDKTQLIGEYTYE